MSELHGDNERLWPPEDEQPEVVLTFEGEEYALRWENTWIQIYITGDESYDTLLTRYSHVLHMTRDNGPEDSDYVIFFFDKLDGELLDELKAKNYPLYFNPTPDEYMREYIADQEIGKLLESLDTAVDLGSEAA